MFSDDLPALNNAYTIHELGLSDHFTDAKVPGRHQSWFAEQNCTSSSKYHGYENVTELFNYSNDHLKILSHNITIMKHNFENLYNYVFDLKFDKLQFVKPVYAMTLYVGI